MAREFKISEDFRKLLVPLTDKQLAQLEANMLRAGKCPEDVEVWKEGKILVDGHTRLELAEKHGLAYGVKYLSFANQREAANYILRKQLGRRNLSSQQERLYLGRLVQNEKAMSAEEPVAKPVKTDVKKADAKKVDSKKDEKSAEPDNAKKGRKATPAAVVAAKTGKHRMQVSRSEKYVEMLDGLHPAVKEMIEKGTVAVSDAEMDGLSKLTKAKQFSICTGVLAGKVKTVLSALNNTQKAEHKAAEKAAEKIAKNKIDGTASIGKFSTKAAVEDLITKSFSDISRAVDAYDRLGPHELHKKRCHGFLRDLFKELKEWERYLDRKNK